MHAKTHWFGPISGVLTVVLVIVSQGISGNIDAEPSDSVGTVMAELSGSADGTIFAMLGAGLLLVYIGHLQARFHEQGAGWAGSVLSAGGVVLVGAVLIVSGAQLTGAEAADQGMSRLLRESSTLRGTLHGSSPRGCLGLAWVPLPRASLRESCPCGLGCSECSSP